MFSLKALEAKYSFDGKAFYFDYSMQCSATSHHAYSLTMALSVRAAM